LLASKVSGSRSPAPSFGSYLREFLFPTLQELDHFPLRFFVTGGSAFSIKEEEFAVQSPSPEFLADPSLTVSDELANDAFAPVPLAGPLLFFLGNVQGETEMPVPFLELIKEEEGTRSDPFPFFEKTIDASLVLQTFRSMDPAVHSLLR
jgi:hypothetical protein